MPADSGKRTREVQLPLDAGRGHIRALHRDAAASSQTAARGSTQAGTSPLLHASACAPSRPRDPLSHTPRGATAVKKTEGKQKNSSSQMMVPQRVTFRVLKGSPILPRHVCGPGRISPQIRPFHQPSDVNFTRSNPKVELYQGVAR